MISEKNFILFEGVCKTGKTSVCKKLSEERKGVYNKGVYAKTSNGEFLKKESIFGNNYSDMFFLTDLIIDTKNIIKPHLSKNDLVFQDRYYHSISAFSTFYSKKNKEDYRIDIVINKLKEDNILLSPKRILYFYSEMDVLIDRLNAEPSDLHNLYLREPSILQGVIDEYNYLLDIEEAKGVKVYRIDTSTKSVEETVKFINSNIF